MFKKFYQRALNLLLIALLTFNQAAFVPFALAQEATEEPSPEVQSTETTQSEELSPTPEPSETPQPSVEPSTIVSPDPSPTPSLESAIEPSPSPSPAPSLDESLTTPPASESAIIDTSTTENQSSASLAPPVWQENPDGSATTINNVVLNQTYAAPQNNKVTVTFTKLPENPGTLTIKQIILSQEDKEDLGAFSDTAYEITSTMPDGAFTYDLTLPVPPSAQGQNVEVIAGESVDTLDTAETVNEPKTTENDVITITGLDHFTIFILVPTGTTGVANGVYSVLDDAFIDQDGPTGNNNGTTMNVYSKTTNKNRRALVKFDLSNVPAGITASTATLKLRMSSAPNSSRQHDVYRITANWTEGSVTWNTQPSTAGASTASAVTGTSAAFITWDVTDDINAFLDGTFTNYGWLVRDSSEDGTSNNDFAATYSSSENGTDTNRPQLIINLTRVILTDTIILQSNRL